MPCQQILGSEYVRNSASNFEWSIFNSPFCITEIAVVLELDVFSVRKQVGEVGVVSSAPHQGDPWNRFELFTIVDVLFIYYTGRLEIDIAREALGWSVPDDPSFYQHMNEQKCDAIFRAFINAYHELTDQEFELSDFQDFLSYLCLVVLRFSKVLQKFGHKYD